MIIDSARREISKGSRRWYFESQRPLNTLDPMNTSLRVSR